jgi:hypothetical protein
MEALKLTPEELAQLDTLVERLKKAKPVLPNRQPETACNDGCSSSCSGSCMNSCAGSCQGTN